MEAPHGSPDVSAATVAVGWCVTRRAEMRCKRGEHHIARIGVWIEPLKILTYELEERRSGYEHASCQAEDVERGVGAKGEEAQTA